MDPARSIWMTATRTRPSASGSRAAGSSGPGGAGAHRAFGEVELEPDLFLRWGCTRRPSGRRAPRRAAGRGRPRGRGCRSWRAGALEGDLALRVAVGDLDPDAVVRAQTQDVRGGARVDHGVGDQFAGEDHGVVDDVREAPALQGVADEGAGGRDRSPDGVEAGSRARGDHRTPRPVLDVRLCHAAPLLACPVVVRSRCPRPSTGRTGVVGQPDARLLTFAVRADAGLQVSAPRGCGRCAKLPNCYGLVRTG